MEFKLGVANCTAAPPNVSLQFWVNVSFLIFHTSQTSTNTSSWGFELLASYLVSIPYRHGGLKVIKILNFVHAERMGPGLKVCLLSEIF